MTTYLKIFLTTSLLLFGQASLANPLEDARFIIQRSFDETESTDKNRLFKKEFATVYFKPLSDLGIEIADAEQFMDLIPDDVTAPYVDTFISKSAELYQSVYPPEQLASIAKILRADKDATIQKIVSGEMEARYADALEKARASTPSSGSDDPLVLGLEELALELNAFVTWAEDGGDQVIAQSLKLAVGTIGTTMNIVRDIQKIEVEPNNPVTIAAFNTDGVLKFANPVQRQTLLRQFGAPEQTGGIRFIKAPTGSAQSN